MAISLFNFPSYIQQILNLIGTPVIHGETLFDNQEKIMTALTDLQDIVTTVQNNVTALQAADAANQAAIQTAITLIQSLHTGAGTVSDAEVEAAVAALTQAAGGVSTVTSDMGTSDTALGGAMPQP